MSAAIATFPLPQTSSIARRARALFSSSVTAKISERHCSRPTFLPRNRTHEDQCKIQVHEIQIVFAFVNSRIPAAPSSRPNPERFTPPKGRRGSDATIDFIKTIPESSSDVKSLCPSSSLVHALEPSPNVLSFAS